MDSILFITETQQPIQVDAIIDWMTIHPWETEASVIDEFLKKVVSLFTIKPGVKDS